MLTHLTKPYLREDVEALLHPFVKEWFFSKFKDFSLPQLYGVRDVHERNNILVIAGTGGTKTLTAFLAILNELVLLATQGRLKDKVYTVYVSPLKALNQDIFVNLEQPLKEINKIAKNHGKELNIRVAVRTGDTTPYERQKMLKQPPHILITTPESLALMLSSMKFKELLRDVTWTILDEIHALAENKRGVHLSLSIERLQDISPQMARIGLSATVEPKEEIAKYLVGKDRICKIADVQLTKQFDLQVISPLPDLIDVTHNQLHRALYKTLDKLIQEHKTTLIFTNTRAGTERVVHHLKTMYPSRYIENIGAHHGSLSKRHRFAIEKKLREGKLKVCVTSTSLELGIDIGYIDLVICLGSPKSVARLLQRCLPYDTPILLADGSYKAIGDIVEKKLDVELLSYDSKKGFVKNRVLTYHKNRENALVNIKLHSGAEITCTREHPLMTRKGWKEVKDVQKNDEIAELFDHDTGEKPYIHEMINQKEFYVENREDFLRKTLREHTKTHKISYSSIAKTVGIGQNHLQNYMRQKGRKKGIRLDIFIRLMEFCGIPRNAYEYFFKELKSKSHHRRPLPLKIDKELMWLAGIVASDGSITRHKKTRDYKIKIGNKDIELLKECQLIFQQYGFFPEILTTKSDPQFKTLDCGSKLLAQVMLSLGITMGKKSSTIGISPVMYKMPKQLIIPFIEGVIEGDGNINRDGGIRIFSASKKFAIGLHNLLNRSGVHNYIKTWKAKISKKVKKINHQEIFCINILRKKYVAFFIEYCLGKGKKIKKLEKQNIKHFIKELDIENNINWSKIESITYKKEKTHVYNLTLKKEPNNYFVSTILTHNCGRAGHQLHSSVKGKIVVMDRDDLVECSVLLKHALEKKIDKVHIPTNCLDVLAQQVYGMAVADRWNVKDVYGLVKKSYCYQDLKYHDFMEIVNYLAGNYGALEQRHVYGKIWYDEKTGEIAKRGSQGKLIYMTNVGTIPDQTGVVVKVGEHAIGTVDEGFLERLKKNDIFVLGGNTYQFNFTRGNVAQVREVPGKQPTVPNWFSEMLPLSFDLASGIQKFRRNMEDLFVNKKKEQEILDYIHNYLYVDANASTAIYQYFKEQYLYVGLPHIKKLLVEFYQDDERGKKYVVFHSLYGRRVNDVLSRAVGYVISRLQKRDVELGITDNGFYVASEKPMQVLRALDVLQQEDLHKIMKAAIEKTEVLKRRFRHCAGRALMILRSYKGRKKTVGRQQVSSMILMHAVKRISDNFCILQEARREVLEDLMDLTNAEVIVQKLKNRSIEVQQAHTTVPSPFAFTLVTQGYTDVLRMEEKIEFIRRMHRNVLAKLGKKHVL